MKKSDYVSTPRFCTVRIQQVFVAHQEAADSGYTEPTHFNSADYDVRGKHIGTNKMVFAAIKK